MLAWEGWHLVFGMPQIAIIVGALIPIVAVIASFWYRAQKTKSENALKRTMIERGFSVEDIERVLSAQSEEPRNLL